MTPARTRILFGVLVVALLLTHVWPPPWGHTDAATAPTIVWGFVPWDLAVHLLWIVAAMGVVLFMTERVWRDADPEDAP